MHSFILMAVMQIVPAQNQGPVSMQSSAPQQARVTATKRDMVLRWNDITLDAIRKERTPPPVAARNLAIVHASIFDAVNAIAGTHKHYAADFQPLPGASPEAATAAAAHRALIDLYPNLRARLDKALIEALAEIPDGDRKLSCLSSTVLSRR